MGTPNDRADENRVVDPIARHDAPGGAAGASWWPITTAAGAVAFVLGVGIFVVGSRVRALVNPDFGLAIAFLGLLIAVGGILGWFYQAFIQQYDPDRAEPPEDKYLWGMLLYMPLELALFGAMILYFAFVYYGSWPPGELPPMLTIQIWIMTGLIIASSFTNLFASRALNGGNQRRFLLFLGTTPILGILFLGLKASNYYRLIVGEGVWIDSGLYWTAFFAASGFHGFLVAVGIVMMLIVFVRGRAGHYSADHHVSMSTTNMYWWMVDSIWLVLIVELYATVAICNSMGTC